MKDGRWKFKDEYEDQSDNKDGSSNDNGHISKRKRNYYNNCNNNVDGIINYINKMAMVSAMIILILNMIIIATVKW